MGFLLAAFMWLCVQVGRRWQFLLSAWSVTLVWRCSLCFVFGLTLVFWANFRLCTCLCVCLRRRHTGLSCVARELEGQDYGQWWQSLASGTWEHRSTVYLHDTAHTHKGLMLFSPQTVPSRDFYVLKRPDMVSCVLPLRVGPYLQLWSCVLVRGRACNREYECVRWNVADICLITALSQVAPCFHLG